MKKLGWLALGMLLAEAVTGATTTNSTAVNGADLATNPNPATANPTLKPSRIPTLKPTRKPTVKPTRQPSLRPTKRPSTKRPTLKPTRKPTLMPTFVPSLAPTYLPTLAPITAVPSAMPSIAPSSTPSATPSATPSQTPSNAPSRAPWNTHEFEVNIAKILVKDNQVKLRLAFPNGCTGTVTLMPATVSQLFLGNGCNSCEIGQSLRPTAAPTYTKAPTRKPKPQPEPTPRPRKPTTQRTKGPTTNPTPEPTTRKPHATRKPTPNPVPTHRPTPKRTTQRPTCKPTNTRQGIMFAAAEDAARTGKIFKVRLADSSIASFKIQQGMIVSLQGMLQVRAQFTNGCTVILNIPSFSNTLQVHKNACMKCAATFSPVPTVPTRKPTPQPRHPSTRRPHSTRSPVTPEPTTNEPTPKPTRRPVATKRPTPPTPRPTPPTPRPHNPTHRPTCGCGGAREAILFNDANATRNATINLAAQNTSDAKSPARLRGLNP